MCLVYKKETGVFALFWYTKKKVRLGLKSVSGEFCFFHCLIVSIPMGTNCAPLVAELFYFVMRETSRCLFLTIINRMLSKPLTLVDLLNTDNPYFEQRISQI